MIRNSVFVILPVIIFCAGESFSAGFSADTWTKWVSLSSADTPVAREGHSMVWDPVNKQLLMFGGLDGSFFRNDLWKYDGANWTQLFGSQTPPGRKGHSAVWDSLNNRMLVFGGRESGTYYNDLWAWDGGDWVQLSGTDTPVTRAYHGAVWDALNNRMLVFGGYDSAVHRNDLWAWNGDWAQLSGADTPAARDGMTVVWNSKNNRMVMFGGYDGSYPRNDVWEWNGTNWFLVCQDGDGPDTPAKRRYHTAVWDSLYERMIIFSGEDSVTVKMNDLWSYGANKWSLLSLGGASGQDTPAERRMAVSAWDNDKKVMLVFGGDKGSYLNDLWRLYTRKTISIVSGNNQSRTVGRILSAPLKVYASINWEKLAGETVTFSIVNTGLNGDGKISPDLNLTVSSEMMVTDANGYAQVTMLLDTKIGLNEVTAGLSSGTTKLVTFDVSGYNDEGILQILSGNDQTSTAGTALPLPLVVRAGDQYNNAVQAVLVVFSTSQGSVAPASGFTDASGQCQTWYTMDNIAGPHKVSASLANTSLTKVVTFDAYAKPKIDSISPDSGNVGTIVTITGLGFGPVQATNKVYFNGVDAGFAGGWNNTGISIVAPADATSGNCTVAVNGQTSNPKYFTVVHRITSLSPDSGYLSASINIFGDGFGATQGTNKVFINGVDAGPCFWTSSAIAATIPINMTAGVLNCTVVVGGVSAVTTDSFLLLPKITSITPDSGDINTSINIYGEAFGSTQGTNVAYINGVDVGPCAWSSTVINPIIPVNMPAGTLNCTVVVSGLTAITSDSFLLVPKINSISPDSGYITTSINISGSGYGLTQGTSKVYFNGVDAGPCGWGSSTITANIPASMSAGVLSCTVSVGGQTSNGKTFNLKPKIDAISPDSGITGSSVVITGKTFSSFQGANQVYFNGINAGSASVWNDTSITVVVPQGATTGNCTVTVNSQVSNGFGFIVKISNIQIVSGNNQQGTVGMKLTSSLIVKVTDQYSNSISGIKATFSAPLGFVFPDSGLTGANGEFQTWFTLDNVSGSRKVSAFITTTSLTGVVTFDLTGIPDKGNAFIEIVSGNNQTGVVNNFLASPFVVRVRDQYSNGLSGERITFGDIPASGFITPISAITNQNGQAQTWYSLGASSGIYKVTGWVKNIGLTKSVTFDVYANPAPADKIEIVNGNGQSGIINNMLASALEVRVSDAFNNVISNAPVTFTIALGGGSLSAGAVFTDTAGQAKVNYTFDNAAGLHKVRAEIASGTTKQATFDLTALQYPADKIEIVSGNNQAGIIGQTLPVPLVVKVSDIYNNVISGTTVTFSVSLGAGSIIGANPAFTTSSGTCQAQYSFDGNSGLNKIVANLSTGTTRYVTFEMTSNVGTDSASARFGHKAVWDVVNNRMLVFGGYLAGLSSYNDLWGYNGTTWTMLTPVGESPPGRRNHSAVWDLQNNRMIIFGGRGYNNVFLNDIWAYDGSSWSRLNPAGTVPSRAFHSAVWDPVENRMVVFGGADTAGACTNTVWSMESNGTVWTKLAISNGDTILARRYHSAIWDARLSKMVVFGGDTGIAFSALNDIWQLNGNSWEKFIQTGDSPAIRGSHTAVWDSANDRMIIFGGVGPSFSFKDDVWTYDGASLVKVDLQGDTASMRMEHSAVWNPVGNRMIVFGGTDIGVFNDVHNLIIPGGIDRIDIVSGNAQTGTVSQGLPQALQIIVKDYYGNPVSGVIVTFAVTTGGGTLSLNSGNTNASGITSVKYTFDDVSGLHQVKASVRGGTVRDVTFDLTALAEPVVTISQSPQTELTDYPVAEVNESYVIIKWKATDDKDNGTDLKYLIETGGETFETSSTEYEKYPIEDGEYTFRVAGIDKDGNTDTTPAEARFSVNTRTIEMDSGAWSMIAFPRKLANTNPQAVFGEDALVYRWNPQAGRERKYQSISEIKTAEGCWAYAGNDRTVNISGEFVNNGNPDGYRIRLYKGWNQIGNPYSYRIKWGECSVVKGNDKYRIGSGEANKSINENIYVYKGNSYEMMDSVNGRLEIWGGYWVYANEECEIEISASPARENGAVIASSPKLATMTGKDGKEWQIRFKVNADGVRDEYNFAGARENASEGYGGEDGLKPPAMGNGVALNFIKDKTRYAKDVRGIVKTIKTWEIEVGSEGSLRPGRSLRPSRSSDPSDIEIKWEGVEGVSKEKYVYYIKDEQSGELVNMREKGEYRFRAGSTGGRYKFKFYVAKPEYEWMITNKGVAIKGAKGYPNPMIRSKHTGIVKVEFMTAEDAGELEGDIKVVIYDVSGEKVAEMGEYESIDNIKYIYRWDGRNMRGINVGTGAYLYVITAKSKKTGQQKIATGRIAVIRD